MDLASCRASLLGIWLLVLPVSAGAQVGIRSGEHCIVQVLNETIPVAADGRWELANIPANGGLVRARLHCIRDGTRRSGQSGFFVIQPNKMNAIPLIPFVEPALAPSKIRVTAPVFELTEVGETVSLAVTGIYGDGSQKPLGGPETGTVYASTAPAVASVGEAGVVTAQASGVALISVLHDGVAAALRVEVQIGQDSDGDGLPDDYENSVGLDPQDPLDALGDQDADNLTAKQEFGLGSNPFDADTDGDGIEDGEEASAGQDGYVTSPVLADTDGDRVPDPVEVAVGTDPSDAASVDLAAAVASLQVTPSLVTLNYSPLLGEASVQLQLTGVTILGTGIDLTNHPGTVWGSADMSVASVGPPEGRVYAGKDGQTTITATAAGEQVQVPVTTKSTAPSALGVLEMPCGVENVRLVGPRVFAACPSAGIVEVDATSAGAMSVTAVHEVGLTPHDLGEAGKRLFVVGEVAGEPVLARFNDGEWGTLALEDQAALGGDGAATSVVVSGADVAVGVGQGVQIRSGTSLGLRGVWPLGGPVTDVDWVGGTLVAVHGATLGLAAVAADGVVTPLGSATAPATIPRVALGDGMAFAAMGNSGVAIFDLSGGGPAYVTHTDPAWAKVRDVGVDGSLVFSADYYRVNSIPIMRVLAPDTSALVGVIEFSQWGDDNGTAIDIALGRAALIASGRLFVGQYGVLTDNNGLAPTCGFAQPASGSTFIVGQTIEVSVVAVDDVMVDAIAVDINGELTASYPARFGGAAITLPLQAGVVALDARAIDLAGNEGACPTVLLTLEDDPGTTIIGTVVDGEGLPVGGAQVVLLDIGIEAITEADGTFVIAGAPAANPLTLEVAADINFYAMLDHFGPFKPAPAALTDVGTLPLKSFVGEHILGGLRARPLGYVSQFGEASADSTTLGGLRARPLGYVSQFGEASADSTTLGGLRARPLGYVSQFGEASADSTTLGGLRARPLGFVAGFTSVGAESSVLGGLRARPLGFVGGFAPLVGGGARLGGLRARTLGFVTEPIIEALSPPTLAAGASQLVAVSGVGVADTVDAWLVDAGVVADSVAITVADADPAAGTVTLQMTAAADAVPGSYVLVVSVPGGQATAKDTGNNIIKLVP